ncbi:MAG: YqgE/AlgH family protein [Nocardioidaceae bacterium]
MLVLTWGSRDCTGDYGLVDLDLPAESLLSDLVGVRVFSGYAGWGEGQLEAEIAEGSWYVANAVPTDVLDSRASSAVERRLAQAAWRAGLRRHLPRRPEHELRSSWRDALG